jgi:hypothetical protein
MAAKATASLRIVPLPLFWLPSISIKYGETSLLTPFFSILRVYPKSQKPLINALSIKVWKEEDT